VRWQAIVVALGAIGLLCALPATAGRNAGAPNIRITPCKSIILANGPSGKYYKCTGVYNFGVPHTAAKLALLISNSGVPKGSSFELQFLDTKTKDELTSPLTLGPVRYNPGLYQVTFDGPFPQGLSMTVQPVYKGKPIPTPAIIRFT
jgi:hypothetical protein